MLLRPQAHTVSYCFDNFLLRHYIHFWPKSRKMSNLRSPAKIFISSLHKAQYSSSNEKVGQELLKQVQEVAENKIISDKIVNLLPYLKHKNIEYISQTNSTEVQPEAKEYDEVEPDKQREHLKPLSAEGTSTEAASPNASESSKVPAKASVIPEAFQEPPHSLPVMMIGQVKPSTVDLANATLPLSIHLKEKKGLIIDAVVQDIKHVYCKTSSTIDSWYLIARSQGKTLYLSAEEFLKHPGIVKDLLQKRTDKNAIAIYDPKLSAIANFDIGSITKKLEEMIKGLIAMIKQMLASKPEKNKSLENKKDDKTQVDAKKSQEDKQSPKVEKKQAAQ